MIINNVCRELCPKFSVVILFACLTATTMLFFVDAAFAGVVIDCRASKKAYDQDPNMKDYTCVCSGDNSLMPVCTPKTSAGGVGGRTSGSSKYNANNAIKMQFMEAAIGALFKDLFAEPDESKNEQLRQQQELTRIAEEEKRQKSLHDWERMKSEAEAKIKLGQDDKINQGNRLLSQMQTIGGGNATQPFGVGSAKLDLKPISQNTFPSSHYSEMQRLMCSAYFSNLAKKTANNTDMRFYADQAQRVMSGEPTYLECRMPTVSNVTITKRMDEIKKIYEQMGEVNNRIQDIEIKLTKTKVKITAAETKKEQITTTLNELQNRGASATQEEKNEIDELLRQAKIQSEQINQQIQQAKQEDTDLQKERELAENEFNTMKTQSSK